MKRFLTICALAALTVTAVRAQLLRKMTVNITPDGQANMVCYLPANPSGRAVVDLPGGGYTHLAMQHEGHDWAEFFNQQGIAFYVVTYRMPGGDRTIPMSQGYMRGDTLVATEGPLVGHEGLITRVNRHKSLAVLEFHIGGKRVTTRVGLGIVGKEQGTAE